MKDILNYMIVDELIPLFFEAGINMMYPFEQQAGNDMLKLRKSFSQAHNDGRF